MLYCYRCAPSRYPQVRGGMRNRVQAGDSALERRYRIARDPHERSWWQIPWLLGKGHTAADIAESTRSSWYWIGQMMRRYSVEGSEAMRNRHYTHSHRVAPLLAAGRVGRSASRNDEGQGATSIIHWVARPASLLPSCVRRHARRSAATPQPLGGCWHQLPLSREHGRRWL